MRVQAIRHAEPRSSLFQNAGVAVHKRRHTPLAKVGEYFQVPLGYVSASDYRNIQHFVLFPVWETAGES